MSEEAYSRSLTIIRRMWVFNTEVDPELYSSVRFMFLVGVAQERGEWPVTLFPHYRNGT